MQIAIAVLSGIYYAVWIAVGILEIKNHIHP